MATASGKDCDIKDIGVSDGTSPLFEYRMEGLDKTWVQASQPIITYANLPPGDYILKIRSSDNSKSESEIRLNIHIPIPFCTTIWAYIFYFFCLLGIILAFIRLKTRQAVLKSSLEFERKEKKRIEEQNEAKLCFFTNISHEFRTPLTLIIGQIEVLMQMDKLSVSVRNRILRIYKCFFKSGHVAKDEEEYKYGSFLLHQACERYYKAYMLVYGGTRPKSHRLDVLGAMSKSRSRGFANVFPVSTSEDREAFDKLCRAYIEARYSRLFTVSKEQYEYMIARTKVLREVTIRECTMRMAYYDKMIEQEEKGSTTDSSSLAHDLLNT